MAEPNDTTLPGMGKKPGKDSYLEQSRDLPSSLVMVLPLLLFYDLGLVITGGKTINGVDFMTVFLHRNWGINGLLLFNGILFAAGMCGLYYLKRERNFNPKIIGGVIIESTIYAVLMGSLILWIMSYIPGFGSAGLDTGAQQLGLFDKIFVSLGAGVNEELVFRLGIYGGITWSVSRFTKQGIAIAVGVLVSSLLFSLAHYAGPESFNMFSFVYRLLAGALFCALFLTRGFAVAVYTHAIYDIYVMVFQNH